MKLDLVSFWPLACEFLQDIVTGLFPSDSLSQDPGGMPSAEQADTLQAGLGCLSRDSVHLAEPSSSRERSPPDPEGPYPLWQLEGKIEANSTSVPCLQLFQAAWRPAGRVEEGRAAGLAPERPGRPSHAGCPHLSPYNPMAECSDL